MTVRCREACEDLVYSLYRREKEEQGEADVAALNAALATCVEKCRSGVILATAVLEDRILAAGLGHRVEERLRELARDARARGFDAHVYRPDKQPYVFMEIRFKR